MIKKTNQQLVTVEILEKTLDQRFEQFGRQITAQIVSQLMEYIDVRINAVEQRLDNVEQRLDSVEQRFDNVEKSLDWLVGAYKKFDEEHSILTGNYSTMNRRIDNHEQRLVVLEKN